jgi:hypothetical protein
MPPRARAGRGVLAAGKGFGKPRGKGQPDPPGRGGGEGQGGKVRIVGSRPESMLRLIEANPYDCNNLCCTHVVGRGREGR